MTDVRPARPEPPSDGTTLSEVLEEYRRAGFASDFSVESDTRVRCNHCATVFDSGRLPMFSLRRLEGASDPADMMAVVAPILPLFLVAAALSAQFSAAVADTSGSGGLVAELTRGRVSQRGGYALLVAAGLALTWTADVFQIISFASRAFAGYYALQAFIAAVSARRRGRKPLAAAFALLGLLGVAIVVFGRAIAA